MSPTDQLFIMKGILQRYGGASVFRNHFAIRRYRATNDSFGNPLIFSLTERGFFSEVNNLLNAIAFGLLTRRRFLVDQTKFQGRAWHGAIFSPLIFRVRWSLLPVDPEWVITDVQSRHFKTIRDEVFERWQRGERFNIASLALEEVDIFTLRRKIAQLFCFRRTVCNFGWSIFDTSSFYGTKACAGGARSACGLMSLWPSIFAAATRSKVTSMLPEKLVIEGEKTPISTYIDLIRKFAPAINKLFVLTDDHAAMDELRSYAPKLGLFTLCPRTFYRISE